MLFEIRNYHFEPSKLDGYKVWATEEAVPYLKAHMDVVGFWVDNGMEPEYGGRQRPDETESPANITWVIRWPDRDERDRAWKQLRAADRVVFHRSHYHSTIRRAVELGVDCDIWTAARAGLVDRVRAALDDEPALLNATDGAGRTPLQRAGLVYGVFDPCEAVVDLLVDAGAHVDIFTAATFGLEVAVARELGARAELARARCQGSTPLNWAVRPRRNSAAATGICRRLLAAGADVGDRDQDESGMTPLHHAAEWGHEVCLHLVDLLLAAGAELNGTDVEGWTALDYARDRGRSAMQSHLLDLGAISHR